MKKSAQKAASPPGFERNRPVVEEIVLGAIVLGAILTLARLKPRSQSTKATEP